MTDQPYKFQYFNVTFPAEYVAHVEINRPEKLNAFSPPMWKEVKAVFEQLSVDSNVRCVLLSGKGDKAFSTGLDVQAASTSGPLASSSSPPTDTARLATILRRHILDYQDCITAIERCEKPVMALLHGYAYGLAIDISTAADIRLCSSTVALCVKETDIGIAADVGTLTRLPKLGVSQSWVNDVAYSARVFGAAEAHRVGFVSRVCEGGKAGVVAAGLDLAKLIASKSPVAVQGTKALLEWSRDRSVEDGLKMTAVWNAGMLQTEDRTKAMMSGLQKRKVTFEKL